MSMIQTNRQKSRMKTLFHYTAEIPAKWFPDSRSYREKLVSNGNKARQIPNKKKRGKNILSEKNLQDDHLPVGLPAQCRPLSIYEIQHDSEAFLCSCPIKLDIMLNFNISKVAYWMEHCTVIAEVRVRILASLNFFRFSFRNCISIVFFPFIYSFPGWNIRTLEN